MERLLPKLDGEMRANGVAAPAKGCCAHPGCISQCLRWCAFASLPMRDVRASHALPAAGIVARKQPRGRGDRAAS
jgi:hypothetical protein